MPPCRRKVCEINYLKNDLRSLVNLIGIEKQCICDQVIDWFEECTLKTRYLLTSQLNDVSWVSFEAEFNIIIQHNINALALHKRTFAPIVICALLRGLCS